MSSPSILTQRHSVSDAEFKSRLHRYGALVERVVRKLCRNCPELVDDARQEAWLALATVRLRCATSPAGVVRQRVTWRVIDFLRAYNPRGYQSFDRAWRRGYRFVADPETWQPVLMACRVKQRSHPDALQPWLY